MKHSLVRWVMAVGLAAAGVVPAAVAAEDAPKALPTLLIKGEIVSVDTNDPTESLVKVKDRYGFETPIYLTNDTKIAQGDQTTTVGQLSEGTPVEVEYNFDINTAKRHAVRVAISQPAAAQASAGATPAAPAAVPAPAPVEPSASITLKAPAATEPDVTPEASPMTPEEPAAEVME